MPVDLRLKIRQFFRKNKIKIYLVLVAIVIVIAINSYLGYLKSIEAPTITYNPHNPIINGSEVKDKKTKETIEDKISQYMDYCNNKEYEKAYNCLSEDCKDYIFKGKLDNFKKYIDYIFDGEKIYSIQNYSSTGNVYIYQVTISEDILATGMNNENSDEVYEEKVVITKDGDNVKFAVAGYISTEDKDIVIEDEYMKIKIEEKFTTYDTVTYKINISNKTNYDIVLANPNDTEEIILSLNGDYREFVQNVYEQSEIAIYANGDNTFTVSFKKYFDETRKETELIFNKIRVLEDYSGIQELWEEEINNEVKEYSTKISLN